MRCKTRCFKATDLWEYRKSMVHTLSYWLFVLLVLRFFWNLMKVDLCKAILLADIFVMICSTCRRQRFCAREFDAMHEFGT